MEGETIDLSTLSRLDIVLPQSFLKESMLAHENDNSDVIQWIGKTSDSLATNIATQSKNNPFEENDKQKLILISVQSFKLSVSEGKISCRFSEIKRSNVQEETLASSNDDGIDNPEKGSFTQNRVDCRGGEIDIVSKTDNVNHEAMNITPLQSKPDVGEHTEATNSATKRKRGRPRKDVTNKENKDIHTEANCNARISSFSSDGISGRRYGLRGVKLSSVIMRAEKGISDNVEDKIYDRTTIKTETKTEVDTDGIQVPEANSDDVISLPEKCDNDEEDYHVGSDQDISDDEWNHKRKRGRPRKKNKAGIPGRVRKLIDLGDNIPTYKRRQRNNQRCVSCRFCQKKFCDYTGVDVHVRRWHSREKDFKSYLEELKDLKIVTCRICNVKCQDRIHLQIHENRAHFRNETVKCKVCNKMYKNILSLRNHMTAVHGVKGQPHLCHHCPAKFKWAITLRQHIQEIHEGKLDIICKICNKRFARNSQLKRHERIHGLDESKRLVCQTCGKGFWYECNYQRHMTLVHGPTQENYHCSYCGKGFNLKSAMVSHVQKVHLNIYPFRCPECKIGIGRRRLLEDHLAQVHNITDVQVIGNTRGRFKYGRNSEDLFYCSHCSLSFCYKTKMVEHMHIDHGTEFPFMCEHCCQGFLEKSFLVNHLRKAHNTIGKEENIEAACSLTQPAEELKCQELSVVTVQDIENVPGSAVQTLQVNSMEVVETEGEVTTGESTNTIAEAASVLLEVASGNNTVHYVIEQSDGGETAVVSQELSNLLLAAEQSLQLTEAGEVELSTSGGDTLTYIPEGITISEGDIDTVSSNVIIENVSVEIDDKEESL